MLSTADGITIYNESRKWRELVFPLFIIKGYCVIMNV